MKRTACGVVLGTLFLAGCHTITEELPTQPTKTPSQSGVLTVRDPVDSGGHARPEAHGDSGARAGARARRPRPLRRRLRRRAAAGAATPLPPEVSRMNTKIHLRGANKWTLDTTPLVGPDGDYCRKIGFTDGRLFCPIRTEGTSDRIACETYAVGTAKDTGRSGPTWYRDGQLCTGELSGCENHEDNQYLLYVYKGGLYKACTRDGVCGEVRGRPVMPRTPVLTAGAAPCERVGVTRAFTTRALGTLLAASCLLAWGCGSLPDETPTQPDPPPPVAAGPTPEPNASPTPARRSSGGPRRSPARPRPRRAHRSRARPRARRRAPAAAAARSRPPLSSSTSRSTSGAATPGSSIRRPSSGRTPTYCAKIGFTDGRAVCPVRPEGNPERQACELYVTGRATDTGRPGPTWTFGGGSCTGRASGCENSADNQYQLRIFQGGVFKACGRNGVCGEVQADR